MTLKFENNKARDIASWRHRRYSDTTKTTGFFKHKADNLNVDRIFRHKVENSEIRQDYSDIKQTVLNLDWIFQTQRRQSEFEKKI